MRTLLACCVLLTACGSSAVDLDGQGPDVPASATPAAPTAPAAPPPAVPSAPAPFDAGPFDLPDGGQVGTFPLFLKNGRTFDQQTDYLTWAGPVSQVTLDHRDQTALPADEGGGSCSVKCTEVVTRLEVGGSVSGRFASLATFNVQLATDEHGGTAVVEACGQTLWQGPLPSSTALAGFNNYPVPSWSVPTAGACQWTVRATSGAVFFRAVTAQFLHSAALPTVDVKVNGADDRVVLVAPARFTLTWTSSNGVCEAAGSWSGSPTADGARTYVAPPWENYAFTLTCSNAAGTVSDTVQVSTTDYN